MSTGALAAWTAVVRWSAWGLLLAGPLLGGWALASARTPVAVPTRAEASRAQPASSDAVAPAGFAELYVAAYVKAADSDADVEELAAYYPPARSMSWSGGGGAERAESASAVEVRQVSVGYWSVTVAARITGSSKNSGRVRYFQVPVRATGGQGASGWTAAALPAEVAAPTGSKGVAPELAYGSAHAPLDSDPAAQTVRGFLAAYLTGRGELDRYLSPGTALHAVRPAPYRAVTVTQIAEHGHGRRPVASAQATHSSSVGRATAPRPDGAATAAAGCRRPQRHGGTERRGDGEPPEHLRVRAGRPSARRARCSRPPTSSDNPATPGRPARLLPQSDGRRPVNGARPRPPGPPIPHVRDASDERVHSRMRDNRPGLQLRVCGGDPRPRPHPLDEREAGRGVRRRQVEILAGQQPALESVWRPTGRRRQATGQQQRSVRGCEAAGDTATADRSRRAPALRRGPRRRRAARTSAGSADGPAQGRWTVSGADDLFVRFRAIKADGFKSLNEGQRVSFVAARGQKGMHAEQVWSTLAPHRRSPPPPRA